MLDDNEYLYVKCNLIDDSNLFAIVYIIVYLILYAYNLLSCSAISLLCNFCCSSVLIIAEVEMETATKHLKPTPTKLSLGGLTLTLVISLIVIGLEMKKPNQDYSLKCISYSQPIKPNQILRLVLRCEKNNFINDRFLQPVLDNSQPVLDKSLKSQKLASNVSLYLTIYEVEANITKVETENKTSTTSVPSD